MKRVLLEHFLGKRLNGLLERQGRDLTLIFEDRSKAVFGMNEDGKLVVDMFGPLVEVGRVVKKAKKVKKKA